MNNRWKVYFALWLVAALALIALLIAVLVYAVGGEEAIRMLSGGVIKPTPYGGMNFVKTFVEYAANS